MAEAVPFGRYLLLNHLTTGGMAELYLAKVVGEGGFEKICAIKRILPHLAEQPAFIRRFLDEARLVARLSHPGIVQVFDLGKEGEHYFLAMEYLPGEDLSAVVRRSNALGRPIPIDVAARVIALAADALHHAHDAQGPGGVPLGLVHRDITPSNLLLTYDGALKVLDFGIATAVDRLERTRTGQVHGKAPYISPERLGGHPADRREDVWGLGLCLHELLTGSPLFERMSNKESLSAVLHDDVWAPSRARTDVPPELDEIVLAALSKDPKARLGTAGALRDALDGFLARNGGGPTPTLLAAFLRELFGPEKEREKRDRARTTAYALEVESELLEAPAPGTAAITTASLRTPRASLDPATATHELAAPTSPLPITPLSTKPHPTDSFARRARWPVAGALLVVVLVGAAIALWLLRSATPTPDPVPLAGPLRGRPTPPPSPGPVAAPPPSPSAAAATVEPASAAPPASKLHEHEGPPSPTEEARPVNRPSTRGLVELAANLHSAVSVDGGPLRSVGKLRLPAGRHRLRVIATHEHAERTLEIDVPAAGVTAIHVPFSQGQLSVHAEPWAEVWLDGEDIGPTPIAGRQVWEGPHVLKLVSRTGSVERTVRIEPGKTSVVRSP